MITTPTTMRAIILDDEKRLVLEDVPTPTPARGEVLVRVAAAGINPCGSASAPRSLPTAARYHRHHGDGSLRHRRRTRTRC